MKRDDERPDVRPLLQADGYGIDESGRVYRMRDLRPVTALPLWRARRYARALPELDPARDSQAGVPHGFGGGESLVFDLDGVTFVQTLRVPSAAERRPEVRTCLRGVPVRAQGITDHGWYWLSLPDKSHVLLHGASISTEVWLSTPRK